MLPHLRKKTFATEWPSMCAKSVCVLRIVCLWYNKWGFFLNLFVFGSF